MKKRPLVVVTRRLPDVIETRMRELFDTRLNLDDKPLSPRGARRGGRGRPTCWCPPSPTRSTPPCSAQAGPEPQADRQFRQRRRQYRRRGGRIARGITVTNTPGVLTEDTADMTMALILAVARRIAEGARVDPRRGMGRLVADLDARPAHHRQAPRHRRHGPHRPGAGAPRQGLRPVDPLPQPPPRAAEDRGRSSRRPTGNPSTRCWRAWTSCRSIARTRRRPTTCSRRGA